MTTPLVTVIIPCYNYGRFLKRAVNSVLDQTFQDFEIIIVDDHSTDNTSEIANNFDDPRVIYIRQPSNVGQSKNRNTGVERAKGKFIAMLDADDWWDSRYLETGVPAFKDSQVGATYLLKQGYTKDGNKIDIPNQRALQGDISNELFVTNFVGTAVIFRKEAIPNGYETQLAPELNNLGVDWWILLDLSAKYKIVGVDKYYYNYNFHGEGSLSSNTEKRILADRIIQQRFLQKHPNLLSSHVVQKATYWRNLREGLYFRDLGKKWTACLSIIKSIIINPLILEPYKVLFVTLIRG